MTFVDPLGAVPIPFFEGRRMTFLRAMSSSKEYTTFFGEREERQRCPTECAKNL